MTSSRWMRACRLAGVVVVSALLWSCASLRPTPAYDALSDAQLTSLYAETIGFVDRMIDSAGTPDGTFHANREFYSRARATVDTLTVRAEARRALDACPSRAISERVLAAVNAASAASYLDAEASGDCQILLLSALRHSFDNMAAFHAAQGERGVPSSARGPLLDGGVGAVLRAAIAVELAKANPGRRL